MKILLLHNGTPDYLAATILHGLRATEGISCIDFPRFNQMYVDADLTQVRGLGFTLFGLLKDSDRLKAERKTWEASLTSYDLILVSGLRELAATISLLIANGFKNKLVLLDSADAAALFPFEAISQNYKIHKNSFYNDLKSLPYFKREWIPSKNFGTLSVFPFRLLLSKSFSYRNVMPISFGFPKEKIKHPEEVQKTKNWIKGIVDEDLAPYLEGSSSQPIGTKKYSFFSESDYYNDIANSRFGVTTKRAGWDCLRHYEIAANASVICFKSLDKKPATCAPHFLDKTNSINYSSSEELLQRVALIKDDEYKIIQLNGWKWINNMTTISVSRRMLEQLKK